MTELGAVVGEMFDDLEPDESYGERSDLIEYITEMVTSWVGGVDPGVADDVFGPLLRRWPRVDEAERSEWLVRLLSAAGSADGSSGGGGPARVLV